MRDDSTKLVIALTRSYNTLLDLIEKNVRGFGLTVSEFGVLEALYHKGEMPVQQLCKKVLVTSGSMTYIINKLEKNGYVKRHKCDRDARVWWVRLTAKGKELIAEVYPKHKEFLIEILGDMSSEDKKNLIRMLFQVKDSLEEKKLLYRMKNEN